MFRAVLLVALLFVIAHGTAAADPSHRKADEADNYIAAIIDESVRLSLPARVERAFDLTLHAASDAFREGRTARAVVLLRTFTFEVRGVKRAKRLRAEVADVLIARTEEAIAVLGEAR